MLHKKWPVIEVVWRDIYARNEAIDVDQEEFAHPAKPVQRTVGWLAKEEDGFIVLVGSVPGNADGLYGHIIHIPTAAIDKMQVLAESSVETTDAV